jgi:hypothetical protein
MVADGLMGCEANARGNVVMPAHKILTNRAPVLTLWAAIVAEELGYDHDAALTLGKAVAGLNAQSKGRRLGIYSEVPMEEAAQPAAGEPVAEAASVELLGRRITLIETDSGPRAAIKGEAIDPASVQRYFEKKFGKDLAQVTEALRALAHAAAPADLEAKAYMLYEQFRPQIPRGKAGWGAKGELNLGLIRSMARRRRG